LAHCDRRQCPYRRSAFGAIRTSSDFRVERIEANDPEAGIVPHP
jgi:hypothetical protein